VIPLAVLLLSQASAAPVVAPPASVPPRFALSARLERRSERVRYHFTNDSTFDTTALVPHFFEQKYDASNTWLVIAADYGLGGARARTEVAWAPRRVGAGSDLDTFFDPTGDVIVSGTDGTVTMGSIALSQRFGIRPWHAWTLGVSLGYRRSRADFPPDFVNVTHTLPASSSRTFTTDRETTWSQVIESGFTADADWPIGARWRATLSTDALPITRGRLTISLPDKYPGMDINAEALSFGAHVRATIERVTGRCVVGGGATFSGAWSYGRASSYSEHAAGVTIYVKTGF